MVELKNMRGYVLRKKIIILTFVLSFGLFFALPRLVLADSEGQLKEFFVNSLYDVSAREKIEAILKKTSERAYFYIEKGWYDQLEQADKEKVFLALESLAKEFDGKIYPKLTAAFGGEWLPGIDGDGRITVLFQQMKEGWAGYFASGDEYLKTQSPASNEREMVYLETNNLFTQSVKSYLAHEFTHLITFNQKDRLRGVQEEIWLNEARADYAPSLLGYNQEYEGSNLKKRVKTFIESPSDSLTEWRGYGEDYGVINVFTHYLVDHYGEEIFIDSLAAREAGISSLNYALKKNKLGKEFGEVFTDWAVAIFLNDCKFGEDYCFKNKVLQNLRVIPSLIFLPSTQKTSISLDYSIKPWSGNWYRVIGGEGELQIKFQGSSKAKFKIPYVLCQNSQFCRVEFLELNEAQSGQKTFDDFGRNYTSLTLIPSVQSKIAGFNGEEASFDFRLSVSVENKKAKEELTKQLETRIAELQAQIAVLKARLAAVLQRERGCGELKTNLFLGDRGQEVNCLQEFLKLQGQEIYPQGLVTGFFGPLTRAAVVRFQEKYALEILAPLGLSRGNGIAGPKTRAKINELLF